MSAIFVCFGTSEECWCCGGWTKAEDGPCPGDDRFCSPDCASDFEEHAKRYKPGSDWCPSCGYDQYEHAPDCDAKAVA